MDHVNRNLGIHVTLETCVHSKYNVLRIHECNKIRVLLRPLEKIIVIVS